MLPHAPVRTHARAWIPALAAVLATAAGCYHRQPGPVPYAAAEAPARIERLPAAGDVARIEVMVRAGSAHDPTGREGTAWLTAELLRHGGTRALDPDTFNRALADLGAEIDVEVGPEVVRFRAYGPLANARAIEALLGAMVSEPRFDEAAFAGAIQRASAALEAHAAGPAMASDAIHAWVFRGHPYGHLMEGRSGDIATIRATEMRQFYADRYVRSATAGCVAAPPPAGDTLGAALTALPPRLYKDVTPRIVEPVEGRRLLWVETAGPTASIHLGRPIELLSGEGDEVRVALRLLEDDLRASIDRQRGLGVVRVAIEPDADAALASVQPMLHIAIDGVAPENVPFVLRTVFESLGSAPDAVSGADAIHAEVAAAGVVARQEDACGFALASVLVPPSDTLGAPIDPAVLLATTRRVWSADGWKVLVAAHDAARIADAIREGNPTPPVYADARPPEVQAEDQRVAAFPLTFQRSAEDGTALPADQLFR